MADDKDVNPVEPEEPLEGGLLAAFGPPDDADREASRVLAWLAGPSDASPGSLHRAAAGDEQSAPSTSEPDRYQIGEEIARGGVGVVYRVLDTKLGRDTAMKVLLERHRDNATLKRRFVEEAQIAGQLQHPGVAPIHDVGVLESGLPYFTMKLVKGQTLTDLLAHREESGANRESLLRMFEKVCQTLAYAHARGVIHRDLKPSNVMVGSFGEVQVMDWGLAKVLAGTERASTADDTSIETIRTGTPALESHVGSVLGTPGYMSPEQARGHVTALDERSDVFGLGAMLCEILTGKPPYVGDTSREIHRQAKSGDTSEALARLRASGTEDRLVTLASRCLVPEPSDRPRHAGFVADELSAHLLSVEQRAKAAELEAVAATVKVRGERKARKLTVALAGAVVAALLVAGGAYLVVEEGRRQEREAQSRREEDLARRVDRAIVEAELLTNQAQGEGGVDLAILQRALQAADYAVQLASPLQGATEGLSRDAQSVRTRIDGELRMARAADARAARNRDMVERLERIRGQLANDLAWIRREPPYAEAFETYRLDVRGDPRVTAAAMRKSGIGIELATALDDWARALRLIGDTDRVPEVKKLLALAQLVDPDPWRTKLRRAVADESREELRALATSKELTDASPLTTRLLAANLAALGENEAAESVYRVGVRTYPGDYWLHLDLALAFRDARSPSEEDRLRSMSAALALRPRSPYAWNAMGVVLSRMGRIEEATYYFRRAMEIEPDNELACYNLGRILWESGDVSGALIAYRDAIRISPRFAEAHYNLGLILYELGDDQGATEALRKAIQHRPRFAVACHALGNVLWRQGDFAAAVREYEHALELRPDAETWFNLGRAWYGQDDLKRAIGAFREATRMRPEYAPPYNELGLALRKSGDLAGAVEAFRAAIRLQPDLDEAHRNLCGLLFAQREVGPALEVCAEAVRLDPTAVQSLYHLGLLQRQSGRFSEALASLERVVELGYRVDEVKPYVKDCESLITLDGRLSALLRGETEPTDAAERIELARVCYFKSLFLTAAGLYRDAFELDPRLSANPANQNRYNAACMAVLAVGATSRDRDDLSEAQRVDWSRQALVWLGADLSLWRRIAGRGSAEQDTMVRKHLEHWQSDKDLAPLRDEPMVSRLPEDVRASALSLWADVETLLRRVRAAGSD